MSCGVAHRNAGCSQIAWEKSEKFTIRKVIHHLGKVINNRNELLTNLFPLSKLHSVAGEKRRVQGEFFIPGDNQDGVSPIGGPLGTSL
jgi:hypothetical protein